LQQNIEKRMSRKPRLAIVTTHPIQYNAPVFRLLASRGNVDIRVFYTAGTQAKQGKFDKGFGREISWDLPLTEGYDHCFVENVAKEPGSHHYKGIDNPSLIREIEDWKATSILIFGWKFKSHLKVIRHSKGKIPILFRGDSTLLDEKAGLKQIIRRLMLTWVYRHIDIALYTGKQNRLYYQAHGLKEKNLVFAPHAVENERFEKWSESDQSQLEEFRRDIGIELGDFVVLYAGKLIPKKNPEFLLRLASALPDLVQLKILIVGNGELEDSLKNAAQTDPRIKFLDFQNQTLMPLVYRLGDVFLLPSLGPGETWGLGLNEAMACGLPVMASDRCGGAPDLIKEGENGIIFNPESLDSVRKYVLSLASDPHTKEKAGRAAREQIKNFNFASVAAAIEQAASR